VYFFHSLLPIFFSLNKMDRRYYKCHIRMTANASYSIYVRRRRSLPYHSTEHTHKFFSFITVSRKFLKISHYFLVPKRRSQHKNSLRAALSGNRIPGRGRDFSSFVQTSSVAHPAFCTKCPRSFSELKRPGRGVDHPHLRLG
jgi:hypothetical protein